MSRLPPPPPAPPSPHYASSGDRVEKKYGEKEYEEIYNHFNEYCADIGRQRLKHSAGVVWQRLKHAMTTTRKKSDDPPPHPIERLEYRDGSGSRLTIRRKSDLSPGQQEKFRKLEKLSYKSENLIIQNFENSEYMRELLARRVFFGVGCGLLSLAMLRWRRGGLGGRLAKSSRSSGGYKFDQMEDASQKTKYMNILGWASDVFLAGFIGVGSYGGAFYYGLFRPRPKITGEGASTGALWISPVVPLVPGRSAISDALCRPFAEEFRKFPRELWRSGAGCGTGDGRDGRPGGPDERGVYEREVLDSLRGFVMNCERRARHEERIRKSLFMPEGTPVLIPFDGVRADEDLDLDDIYIDGDGRKEKDDED